MLQTPRRKTNGCSVPAHPKNRRAREPAPIVLLQREQTPEVRKRRRNERRNGCRPEPARHRPPAANCKPRDRTRSTTAAKPHEASEMKEKTPLAIKRKRPAPNSTEAGLVGRSERPPDNRTTIRSGQSPDDRTGAGIKTTAPLPRSSDERRRIAVGSQSNRSRRGPAAPKNKPDPQSRVRLSDDAPKRRIISLSVRRRRAICPRHCP